MRVRLREVAARLGSPGAAHRAAAHVLAAAGRPALLAESAIR
jgi:hypothetical protein